MTNNFPFATQGHKHQWGEHTKTTLLDRLSDGDDTTVFDYDSGLEEFEAEFYQFYEVRFVIDDKSGNAANLDLTIDRNEIADGEYDYINRGWDSANSEMSYNLNTDQNYWRLVNNMPYGIAFGSVYIIGGSFWNNMPFPAFANISAGPLDTARVLTRATHQGGNQTTYNLHDIRLQTSDAAVGRLNVFGHTL